jgi:hypothetical protein
MSDFVKEKIMTMLHRVMLGSAILLGTQLVSAQQSADISTGSQGPASVSAAGQASEGSGREGAVSGASEASGGFALGTIVQTAPPTQAQRPGFDTDDPFIQRREARAQARSDYRARVAEARQQARADYQARVAEARQQLRDEQRAADAAMFGFASGQ